VSRQSTAGRRISSREADLAREAGWSGPNSDSAVPQVFDFLADFGMVVPIVHFAFHDCLRSTELVEGPQEAD
jgi:hypothetical protein